MSKNIDFKPKLIRRDREGHRILKGKHHPEDIAILNIYAPNTRACELIKDTLLQLKSPSHTNSGRLKNPTLTNGQFI